MAREEAQRLLGDVAKGADPATVKGGKREAATVAELCDLYIEDAEGGRLLTRRQFSKRSSTVATDRGRIERHIKPLLGQHKVGAVTREDIECFMHDVANGKTATRTKTVRGAGWRMSGVVEAQQAEPLAFLARSSPMRNGTACGQTTLCVASFGSQTESVNAHAAGGAASMAMTKAISASPRTW